MNIFQQAWDLLWAANLKRRESVYAWKGSDGHYLTASDLADKVRELSTGKQWYTGRAGGKWLNAARDWLSSQEDKGVLQGHNFGRHHISGRRYRPAGEAITETEKKTVETRERLQNKPKPRHFTKNGNYYGDLLCVTRKPNFYSSHRSTASRTTKVEEVTCPRCLKLLKERDRDFVRESASMGACDPLPGEKV